MKKIIFTLAIALFCAITVQAQGQYEKKVFVVGNDSLRYRLLVPEKAAPGKAFPLVVFLHGAGERGSDNERQLTWGSQIFLNPVNRAKYPAYVLFPQCPNNYFWAYDEKPASYLPSQMPVNKEPSLMIKLIRGLILDYINHGNIDPSRIYVVGVSMGAMATYDLVARYPDLFAVAVPICGTVNPSRLDRAKNVKFRIFHGDADSVVPVEGSRAAYYELKKIGADVDYTEFAGCDHGSWNPAFNTPNFLKEIFSVTKPAKK